MNYVYLLILLLIPILALMGLQLAITNKSLKIKSLSIIIFLCFIVRSISLLILLYKESIINLYTLKPFFLLNFISTPIAALTIIYVGARNYKIKFNYIYLLSSFIVIIYIYFLKNINFPIKLTNNYGYVFVNTSNIIWIYYIILFLSLVLFQLILLNKKTSNKKLLTFSIFINTIYLIDIIFNLFNFILFPNLVLGDLLWILMLICSLH